MQSVIASEARQSGDTDILTNRHNNVLYTGITGDLRSRIHQHQEKLLPGFTNRYNVSKLVYYEAGYDPFGAIAREKQIKAGSRRKKIDLINRLNRGAVIGNEIASSRRSSQ